MKKLILLLIISLSSFASDILNNDLIVVHPSKHYHNKTETISKTNRLIKKSNRAIMLYQFEPSSDPLWYADLTLENQIYVYSRSGENSLSLSEKNKSIEINMVGGYLTSCLGRAIADIMATFIKSKKLQNLTINLHTKAIFTGHLLVDSKLNPVMPYEESILDDSIDGLNFSDVLGAIKDYKRSYLDELLDIGFIKNAPMMVNFKSNFRINLLVSNKQILSKQYIYPENKAIKFIKINFIQ